MANLATNVRWTSNSPPIYFDIDYGYARSGTDMQYAVRVTIHPLGTDPVGTEYYFGYPINCQVYMDGVLVHDNVQIKQASPERWTSDIVWPSTLEWKDVHNKVSGTTKLSVRLYSIYPGVNRDATYTYDMQVVPAASTITAQNGQIGSNLPITINRASDAYTHTISYSIGGTTGTVVSNFSGASVNWAVPVSLTSAIPDALSGSCTLTCNTYSNGTLIGTSSTNVTISVPGASDFTLSPIPAPMDGVVNVAVSKSAPPYRHTLSFTVAGITTDFFNVDTQFTWVIPIEDILPLIPSSQTSCLCIVECTTYNGSAVVGITRHQLQLLVPRSEETKPVINSMVLSPVNTGLDLRFAGVFIQKKSQLKAVIDATSEYSEIAEYALTVDGYKTTSSSGTVTSDTLVNSGAVPVIGRATDARGFYAETEQSISVVPYTACYVSPAAGETSIICARCDSDGELDDSGTHLKITCKRNYSKIESGSTQLNTCTVRMRYKSRTAPSFNPWTTLIAADAQSDTYDDIIQGVYLDTTTSYDVEIECTDDIGSTRTMAFVVSSDSITLHLGMQGNKAAFFKYAERDGYLDIDGNVAAHNLELSGDAEVSGDVYAQFLTLSEGASVEGSVNAENFIAPGGEVRAGFVSAADGVSTGSITITETPTWTAPTPFSSRCTVVSGGYSTIGQAGKRVYVHMVINVPNALQASDTYLTMLTGMPAPLFGFAALQISKVSYDGLGNGVYNCCVGAYTQSGQTEGRLFIRFGQYGITAGNTLVITGEYWTN